MADRPDWRIMPRDEKISAVKDLCAKGNSCGMIADLFRNVSRNAIIGLIHRVEKEEGKPMTRAGGQGKSSQSESVPRMRKNSAPKPIEAPTQPTPAPAPAPKQHIRPFNAQLKADAAPIKDRLLPAEQRGSFKPLPGVKPIALVNITLLGKCRWPVEIDQPGHFYCGDTTAEDSVWCAHHYRLGTAKAQSKELVNG